jgi:pilus assembly protein FimV
VRNLNKTLAIVSLLAPVSVHSLGVGDIKLHSALNQKLNAEIPLIVSRDENPANIRVSLAPPEKFDEAGVPWSYFLSKIKFKTVTRSDGSVVIKLSSNEALREPFLDFLLEVTWDKGNLYREFTVLVDPPSSYNQPVIPVANPATTQAPNAQATQPASQSKPSAAIQVENELASGGRYGPTRRSDTLWDIAAKLRPRKDISIEQMMIALYEANPGAFYKPNVNALMAGKKLKVPDINSILKISRKQAARIFRQQYQEWTHKTSKVTKAKTKDLAGTNAKIGQQLELVAPVESTVDATAQMTAQPETTENATNQNPDNKPDVATVQGTDGLDNKALLARLEKLEQQLNIMQQMLAVKDAQLALLQNQEKTESAKGAGAESTTKSPGESQVEAKAKAEMTSAEKVKPVDKATPAVKKTVKQAKQPAPPVQDVESESGLFADFYYAIVGGASILILGLLAWLWVRKRQAEEEIDTESMFAASSQIIMPDSEIHDETEQKSTFTEENQSAYDVGTVGESSFLSEFTPSDFDAFDADQNEVDPIAEADVYLAYGRFQQAEELMRQAIKEHPDRKECKLKLLEIYYASENKEAFEAYVHELSESSLKEDADFWEKVEEMQKELGIELDTTIASATAAMDAAPMGDNGDDSHSDDLMADMEGFDAGAEAEQKSVESAKPESIAKESKQNADFEDDAVLDLSSLENLDFDLNSFGEGHAETVETDKTSDQADIETLEFDLDFSAGTTEEKPDEAEKTALDTELETFDFQTEIESKPESQEAVAESKDADEESFDFDFNFEESSFNVSSQTETENQQLGVSDLTDMDEFETKLDLAKAYIDMGDMEAAKNAAEEVLEKGNDQQKEAARKIIDSL